MSPIARKIIVGDEGGDAVVTPDKFIKIITKKLENMKIMPNLQAAYNPLNQLYL